MTIPALNEKETCFRRSPIASGSVIPSHTCATRGSHQQGVLRVATARTVARPRQRPCAASRPAQQPDLLISDHFINKPALPPKPWAPQTNYVILGPWYRVTTPLLYPMPITLCQYLDIRHIPARTITQAELTSAFFITLTLASYR